MLIVGRRMKDTKKEGPRPQTPIPAASDQAVQLKQSVAGLPVQEQQALLRPAPSTVQMAPEAGSTQAPGRSLSYADLMASARSAAHTVVNEQYQRVQTWMTEHTAELRSLSLRGIVLRTRRTMPGVGTFADAEIEAAARGWAQANNISIRQISIIPEPGETGMDGRATQVSNNQMVEFVRNAISTATDGVQVVGDERTGFRISASGATGTLAAGQFRGEASVSPSGDVGVSVGSEQGRVRGQVSTDGTGSVSVESRQGPVKTSASLSFDGTLGLRATAGIVDFGATISRDRWTIQLTIGGSPGPLISSLQGVFHQAESSMRSIVGAAVRNGVSDISALSDQISPHVAPIRQAITTASAIAQQSSGSPVSFGVSASGSPQGGVSVVATLTIRF